MSAAADARRNHRRTRRDGHLEQRRRRASRPRVKDGAKGTDVLLPGATFSRTYDKAGSFDYACAVHAYMTGEVIVGAP
jgi:plastocyanin